MTRFDAVHVVTVIWQLRDSRVERTQTSVETDSGAGREAGRPATFPQVKAADVDAIVIPGGHARSAFGPSACPTK